jgi:hypothetical protein
MGKVYRNVFLMPKIPKLHGTHVLRYTGILYRNAVQNELREKGYDRDKDIYLGCRCDAARYHSIVRVTESKIRRG